jgi:hypothetical protein
MKAALPLLAMLGMLAFASPASAAVCADYSNQAAAQRAADTRDADGDGIYCEALPCPCSTGSAAPAPPPVTVRKTCSSSSVRATIKGAVKCLKSGEFCKASWALAYRRYGFRCTTMTSDGRARLRRR